MGYRICYREEQHILYFYRVRLVTDVKSFFGKQDPLAEVRHMDWGAVTPEFSNEQTRSLVHVFNHELQDGASVERSLRFAAGRIRWYNAYLRNAFGHHEVVFDDSGQDIGADTRRYIRQKLKPYAKKITLMSERG